MREGTRPPWGRWGLLLLLLAIGINAVFRAGFDDAVRTDVSVYRAAGVAALEHSPIYDARNERGSPYVYPPITALCAIPLALVPLPVAAGAFYLLSLGALVLALWTAGRCLEEGAAGRLALRQATAACALLFIDVFTRGQVGHWILLGLVVALFGWLRNRPALAGVALGAAMAIKPTPAALLVLFFALRREWRFVLSSLAGAILWLWLVPALYFGPSDAAWLLFAWGGDVLHAAGSPGIVSNLPGVHPDNYLELSAPTLPNNQSLLAGITRLLLWLTGRDDAALRAWARAIAAIGVVALLLASFATWRRRVRDAATRVLQFSLPVLVLLVSAPLARDDYFVALFPAVLGLLAVRQAQDLDVRRRLDRWLRTAAVLVLLPLLVPQLRPAAPMLIGALLLWVTSQRVVLGQLAATRSSNRIQPKSASTTMV